MKKNSRQAEYNDKLNPFFQQHHPQGRVQAGDFAFFMKKNSFMQYPVQERSAGRKEDEEANNTRD